MRELLERKQIVLRGRTPKPGSVDEVISDRFDRVIRGVCDRHGLAYPEGVDSFNESKENADATQ